MRAKYTAKWGVQIGE
ncbi:MAG: DUF6783 domain-containing protein [Ruminococcus sp.]